MFRLYQRKEIADFAQWTQGPALPASPAVFRILRARYAGCLQELKGCLFPVVRGADEVICYAVYEADEVSDGLGERRRIPFSVLLLPGEKLSEAEHLDDTLLRRYQRFRFLELDEYSCAIWEYLSICMSTASRYMEDPLAAALDAAYFSDVNPQTPGVLAEGKLLTVTGSGPGGNLEAKKGRDVYDSVNVINSLCWSRFRRPAGAGSQTVFTLTIDNPLAGMAELVRTACGYAQCALDRGWIPEIKILHTQYEDADHPDFWSSFFQPLYNREETDKEALPGAVVDGALNGLEGPYSGMAFLWNPYLREAQENLWSLQLRPSLQQELEQGRHKNLPRPVLGVVGRGSDYAMLLGRRMKGEVLAQSAKGLMEELGCRCVYLATEEEPILTRFQEVLKDQLYYGDQWRVDETTLRELPPHTLLADLAKARGVNGYEWGRSYLQVLWELSEADELCASLPCGATYLAGQFRRMRGLPPFGNIHMLSQREGNAGQQTWSNVLRRRLSLQDVHAKKRCAFRASLGECLRRQIPLALYGIGTNARAVLADLQLILEAAALSDEASEHFAAAALFNGASEYCAAVALFDGVYDRRAETKPLLFYKQPVLSPEAIEVKDNLMVIVTPWFGRDEICAALLQVGFRPEQLLKFPMEDL